MKKTIKLLAIFLMATLFCSAQGNKAIKVTMEPGHWSFDPGVAEFVPYKSLAALHILKSSGPWLQVVLKDLNFRDGTIEYDLEPDDSFAAHFFFHRKDKDNNEHFLLRLNSAGRPHTLDAVQYTPFFGGASAWNLYNNYQGPAVFSLKQWNHIKLVISGAEMLVFVNNMQVPVLSVPQLEGDARDGAIAFSGTGYIANLVVKSGELEGLSSKAGFDDTYNDPRYLRDWQVTKPLPLPLGRELCVNDFPKADTGWHTLQAERRGLVNLSRLYGKTDGRRAVWLRIKLKAAKEQVRKVDFGFCNEAWVFINGSIAFCDKNYDGEAIQKNPDGTCSLENASFNLPLKEGENELLVGIANTAFGWAIIARLDSMEGIEVTKAGAQ